MNDTLRGLIMAAVQSFVNLLVLLGVVHLGVEALSGINVFVGNLVLLVAFFWKTGQQPAP